MVKKNLDGLFFGLPTQATSNGIFSRIEDWFEERGLEATGEIGTLMCGVDCTAEMIDRLEKGAETDG